MPTPARAPGKRLAGWQLLVLAVVVVLGVAMRARGFGAPPELTWDEHHFVPNAQHYIGHSADTNDHPPLGKFLIAAGILVLGDDARGWRIAPLLLGLLAPLLAAGLARALWPGVRYVGSIALAFVALDGFFIAFSRTALLDGMLATFYLGGVWLVARCRGSGQVALAALAAGVAASIKWTGGTLLLPLAWVIVERRLWKSLWLLPLAPLAYFALHAVGLGLAGQEVSVASVVMTNVRLLLHHLGLTDMTHPATSHWYTWLVMYHPIVLRNAPLPHGRIGVLSMVGNPLLWWCASLVMVLAPFAWLASLLPRHRGGVYAKAGFVFVAWLAPVLPWIVSSRDSYHYHYLPAYGIALVGLAGVTAQLAARRPRLVIAFLASAFALSLFFAPIWCELPIKPSGFEARTWFESWR